VSLEDEGISQPKSWEWIETLIDYPQLLDGVCISQPKSWEWIETNGTILRFNASTASPSLKAGSGLKHPQVVLKSWH